MYGIAWGLYVLKKASSKMYSSKGALVCSGENLDTNSGPFPSKLSAEKKNVAASI